MRQWLFFVVVIGIAWGGISTSSAESAEGNSGLTYRLNKAHWALDFDPDLPPMGPEHYLYTYDHSIDLNVIPMNENLAAKLKEEGSTEFVKQAFAGKNRINKMFGVGESELIDFKTADFYGVKVLQIRAKQQIGAEHISTLEKYYMSGKKTLHVELRWRDTSDSKKQKEAEEDLSKIALRVPAGAAP